MTRDPNTSAEVWRYKGSRIVIQMVVHTYTTVCQEEGMLLHKYRTRKGRCIAILFKHIGGRDRCDSPASERVHFTCSSCTLGFAPITFVIRKQ